MREETWPRSNKINNTGRPIKKTALYFLLGALCCLGLFYTFMISRLYLKYVFEPLAYIYAHLSGWLLNVLGFQTAIYGDTISSNEFAVSVREGCTGLEPMALLISVILPFPAPVKKKVIGILIGSLLLFVVNWLRIVSLFVIGVHFPSVFDAFHLEIWQVLLIIISVALWLIWIRWVMKKKTA